jgi:hypothetical protein
MVQHALGCASSVSKPPCSSAASEALAESTAYSSYCRTDPAASPTHTCAAGCASRRIFCPYLSTTSLQRGSRAPSCCSGTLSSRYVLRATGAWLRGSGDADAAHACTPGRVSCSHTPTYASVTLPACASAYYPDTSCLAFVLAKLQPGLLLQAT